MNIYAHHIVSSDTQKNGMITIKFYWRLTRFLEGDIRWIKYCNIPLCSIHVQRLINYYQSADFCEDDLNGPFEET